MLWVTRLMVLRLSFRTVVTVFRFMGMVLRTVALCRCKSCVALGRSTVFVVYRVEHLFSERLVMNDVVLTF